MQNCRNGCENSSQEFCCVSISFAGGGGMARNGHEGGGRYMTSPWIIWARFSWELWPFSAASHARWKDQRPQEPRCCQYICQRTHSARKMKATRYMMSTVSKWIFLVEVCGSLQRSCSEQSDDNIGDVLLMIMTMMVLIAATMIMIIMKKKMMEMTMMMTMLVTLEVLPGCARSNQETEPKPLEPFSSRPRKRKRNRRNHFSGDRETGTEREGNMWNLWRHTEVTHSLQNQPSQKRLPSWLLRWQWKLTMAFAVPMSYMPFSPACPCTLLHNCFKSMIIL